MDNIKLDTKALAHRAKILKIIDRARRGHIISAFSILEILRVLYDDVLSLDHRKPFWADRDRFILSKGHGCLALYVILAEKGFFPEDELYKFCQAGALLGGHPEYGKIPGVEASTGSLGHGLAIGIGIALNGVLDNKSYRTFVLLGDGECNEGSIWEAAMIATKHKLGRLVVLVDYNKMQCTSSTYEILDLEPFAEKWKSFGFEVAEVDGHDLTSIRQTLLNIEYTAKKPHAVICHTTKGKGIPILENNVEWHHKSGITDDEIKMLLSGLERRI